MRRHTHSTHRISKPRNLQFADLLGFYHAVCIVFKGEQIVLKIFVTLSNFAVVSGRTISCGYVCYEREARFWAKNIGKREEPPKLLICYVSRDEIRKNDAINVSRIGAVCVPSWYAIFYHIKIGARAICCFSDTNKCVRVDVSYRLNKEDALELNQRCTRRHCKTVAQPNMFVIWEYDECESFTKGSSHGFCRKCARVANPTKRQKMLSDKTKQRKEMLMKSPQVYSISTMSECEWRRLIGTDTSIISFIQNFHPPFAQSRQTYSSDDQIILDILQDRLRCFVHLTVSFKPESWYVRVLILVFEPGKRDFQEILGPISANFWEHQYPATWNHTRLCC